jgi:hypothetical protein
MWGKVNVRPRLVTLIASDDRPGPGPNRRSDSRKGSERTLPARCRDAIPMESDSSFRLASWRRALAVAIGSASNLGFAPRVERPCRRRGRAASGAKS